MFDTADKNEQNRIPGSCTVPVVQWTTKADNGFLFVVDISGAETAGTPKVRQS